MAKESEGMSQVAYAKSRGISTRYVRTLTRKGVIVIKPNGKIDGLASDAMRERCILPRVNPYDTTPVDLADVERRLDAWLTPSS